MRIPNWSETTSAWLSVQNSCQGYLLNTGSQIMIFAAFLRIRKLISGRHQLFWGSHQNPLNSRNAHIISHGPCMSAGWILIGAVIKAACSQSYSFTMAQKLHIGRPKISRFFAPAKLRDRMSPWTPRPGDIRVAFSWRRTQKTLLIIIIY